MPRIFRTIPSEVKDVNDRFEATIVAFNDDDNKRGVTYKLNISYKKHMVEAYKTNTKPILNSPRVVNKNTIVNAGKEEFRQAFEGYVRSLASKMIGKDSSSFDPSAKQNRITTTKQISFTSDSNRLSGNIHCFPIALHGPTQSRAIQLSNKGFDNFKKVAKCLFDASDRSLGPAKKSWEEIGPLIKKLVGCPSQLLKEREIVALEKRLGIGEGARRGAKKKRGEAERQSQAIGKPSRAADRDRVPFRSRG